MSAVLEIIRILLILRNPCSSLTTVVTAGDTSLLIAAPTPRGIIIAAVVAAVVAFARLPLTRVGITTMPISSTHRHAQQLRSSRHNLADAALSITGGIAGDADGTA